MNQKLSDWASIAEILSGIAVVVTLVLLLLGIQENAALTRASMYSDIVDSLNELELDIAGNSDLSPLWSAYIDQDVSDLTNAEKRRLRAFVLVDFRIYEKAFLGRDYGVIGDAEWERFTRTICSHFGRAKAIDFDLTKTEVLTAVFRSWIESNCAAGSV